MFTSEKHSIGKRLIGYDIFKRLVSIQYVKMRRKLFVKMSPKLTSIDLKIYSTMPNTSSDPRASYIDQKNKVHFYTKFVLTSSKL